MEDDNELNEKHSIIMNSIGKFRLLRFFGKKNNNSRAIRVKPGEKVWSKCCEGNQCFRFFSVFG